LIYGKECKTVVYFTTVTEPEGLERSHESWEVYQAEEWNYQTERISTSFKTVKERTSADGYSLTDKQGELIIRYRLDLVQVYFKKQNNTRI
jgi:hypothetical protein